MALADLVASPFSEKHYLAILTPYDIDGAALKTIYYSTQGFTTEPADTPSNQHFEGRIDTALSFSRSMFQQGVIGGKSIPSFGELRLANPDGALDDLSGYAFDGRAVTIKLGAVDDAYSDYSTIFEGTADGIEFTDTDVVIRLRDFQETLTLPIQTTLYAGTGGNEGGADLKGTRKPLCFGRCLNVTPIMIDAATGLYQVHDGPINDVDALYVGGVGYTKVAAPPGANQYSVNVTTGVVTVNGGPLTAQVTCDVQGSKPSTYLVTTADIMDEIVQTYGGFSAGDIDATSISDLNTANSATVGIYVDGKNEKTILSVLDELIASVGGFYGFNRSGKFEVGQIVAPTGTADGEYSETEILSLQRVPTHVASHRVTLGYEPNWTKQVEFQLAAGAASATRDFTAREFRHVTTNDAAVLTKHLNATELKLNTLMDSSAAATTEAARLLVIYKADRDVYRVRLKVQPFTLHLNDVVQITFGRYGLTSGKKFLVVGLVEDADLNEIELELWG